MSDLIVIALITGGLWITAQTIWLLGLILVLRGTEPTQRPAILRAYPQFARPAQARVVGPE